MGSSQAMRKPDSPVSSMLKEPLQPALRKERGSQMSKLPCICSSLGDVLRGTPLPMKAKADSGSYTSLLQTCGAPLAQGSI